MTTQLTTWSKLSFQKKIKPPSTVSLTAGIAAAKGRGTKSLANKEKNNNSDRIADHVEDMESDCKLASVNNEFYSFLS